MINAAYLKTVMIHLFGHHFINNIVEFIQPIRVQTPRYSLYHQYAVFSFHWYFHRVSIDKFIAILRLNYTVTETFHSLLPKYP
jgi:hypothetical protein